MNIMTIDQLVSAVRDTNTIFGVTFEKKGNGEIRTMQCRMHVTKGVKGVLPQGQRKAEDAANSVLTVYDMQVVEREGDTKGAFRRINLDGLQTVTLRGTRYTWDNATQRLVS